MADEGFDVYLTNNSGV
jgi:pimeloyl-ACP methyl ester carboxylesterase